MLPFLEEIKRSMDSILIKELNYLWDMEMKSIKNFNSEKAIRIKSIYKKIEEVLNKLNKEITNLKVNEETALVISEVGALDVV